MVSSCPSGTSLFETILNPHSTKLRRKMPSPRLKCRNSAISSTVAAIEMPQFTGDFRPIHRWRNRGAEYGWRRERNWGRTFSTYSIVAQRTQAHLGRVSRRRPSSHRRMRGLWSRHSLHQKCGPWRWADQVRARCWAIHRQQTPSLRPNSSSPPSVM